MNADTLRKLILVSTLTLAGTGLIGCASNQKTQKQAATEQWNQTRATVLCSLANDQYTSGNLDKCKETLNTAMPMDPTNVRLMLLAARVDVEQGNLESARQQLERAATAAPKDAEVDYLVGVVQERWQKPQLARDAYARAAAKRPDDVAYLLAEAEMYVQLNDSDGALSLLKDRSTYFEHSAAIRDAIGQLLEQSGNRAGAIEYYRQASVLDGDDLGIRERLGLVLYQQGDSREALSQLSRVLRDPTLAGRGDLQIAAGECELNLSASADARKRFEIVASKEPTNAVAWLGVAKASLALGDLRRADYAVNRVVALPGAASMPSTYAVMGYVRLRQGRYSEAAECFRRASAGDPKDPTTLCMLGVSLSKLGQADEARACYARALAANPNDELATALTATATASAGE